MKTSLAGFIIVIVSCLPASFSLIAEGTKEDGKRNFLVTHPPSVIVRPKMLETRGNGINPGRGMKHTSDSFRDGDNGSKRESARKTKYRGVEGGYTMWPRASRISRPYLTDEHITSYDKDEDNKDKMKNGMNFLFRDNRDVDSTIDGKDTLLVVTMGTWNAQTNYRLNLVKKEFTMVYGDEPVFKMKTFQEMLLGQGVNDADNFGIVPITSGIKYATLFTGEAHDYQIFKTPRPGTFRLTCYANLVNPKRRLESNWTVYAMPQFRVKAGQYFEVPLHMNNAGISTNLSSPENSAWMSPFISGYTLHIRGLPAFEDVGSHLLSVSHSHPSCGKDCPNHKFVVTVENDPANNWNETFYISLKETLPSLPLNASMKVFLMEKIASVFNSESLESFRHVQIGKFGSLVNVRGYYNATADCHTAKQVLKGVVFRPHFDVETAIFQNDCNKVKRETEKDPETRLLLNTLRQNTTRNQPDLQLASCQNATDCPGVSLTPAQISHGILLKPHFIVLKAPSEGGNQEPGENEVKESIVEGSEVKLRRTRDALSEEKTKNEPPTINLFIYLRERGSSKQNKSNQE